MKRGLPMKTIRHLLVPAALSFALAIAAGAADKSFVYHVEQNCAGVPACYTSVQSALKASATVGGDDWVIVEVGAGEFREKVNIWRAKTVLRGKGTGRTRLIFDAVAETAGSYHRSHWGTPGSATLTVDADQVTVENLTVENGFDFLANDALSEGNPRKIANSQAAAVLLDIHSDRVLMSDVSLLGYQDTLFANGARAYIRRSLIAGNVDFIFGNGTLLIEDSEIRTRPRSAAFAKNEVQSFVVAPSTPIRQRLGIVVYRSRLTREAGVPDHSVALGRPWHPTTRFPDGHYADPSAVGQASFIDCFMDAHIRSDHWTSMNGTARDGSKTAMFRPEDARFSETGSYGPGARHTKMEALRSDSVNIQAVYGVLFDGWRPPGP